jgi:hypothetical protein
MSTTIERALRVAGTAALALSAWAAIMLAMPFVGPRGRDVAVIGPVAAVAAAGGRIVAIRRGAILARSPDRGFVARLYRHGARVVLEGRIAAGCLAPAQPNDGA